VNLVDRWEGKRPSHSEGTSIISLLKRDDEGSLKDPDVLEWRKSIGGGGGVLKSKETYISGTSGEEMGQGER
jgi:hypothetical protein